LANSLQTSHSYWNWYCYGLSDRWTVRHWYTIIQPVLMVKGFSIYSATYEKLPTIWWIKSHNSGMQIRNFTKKYTDHNNINSNNYIWTFLRSKIMAKLLILNIYFKSDNFSLVFIRPSLRRDVLWYTNVWLSVSHVATKNCLQFDE
jgi:hypothetical protein